MDKLLQQLEQLSRDLTERLTEAGEQEISQFLDHRDQLIEQVKQMENKTTLNQSQAGTLQRIASYDQAILGRMQELKSEAAQGISRVSRSRVQSKAYEMPYSPDGVYFDKKK